MSKGPSKTTYQFVVLAAALIYWESQIRRQATDEADAQLTESIKKHGILQPVGVRPTDGGKYKLVWGHRRLRCALAAGLTEIPAFILNRDMTEGEFLALQMQENIQRADLHPHDIWTGCVRLLEANPGWLQKDLAWALNVSEKSITVYLSPSKCTPEWQAALKEGKVGISDCYAASRLSDPAAQNGLLRLKLSGASRDRLEQAAQAAAQPAKPRERIARVRIPLAVKETSAYGTVTVAGPAGEEIGWDQVQVLLEESLRAVRDAKKRGLGARAAQSAWKDMAQA